MGMVVQVDAAALVTRVMERARAIARRLPPQALTLSILHRDPPPPVERRYLSRKQIVATHVGVRVVLVPVAPRHEAYMHALQEALARHHYVVVQLPLPPGVDRDAIITTLPHVADPDVLGKDAREAFERGEHSVLPPVVGAVEEIVRAYRVPLAGRRAVVVGEGYLVGAPVAVWLAQQGARVVVVRRGDDIERAVATADIVVSGVGKAGVVPGQAIKSGAVVIDAGTSEVGGALRGDVAPVPLQAALTTTVPGGVGPLAVARLVENVVQLAHARFCGAGGSGV